MSTSGDGPSLSRQPEPLRQHDPEPAKKNRRPDQTDVLAAEFQKVQRLRQDLSEPPPDVNAATPTAPQTTASPSSVIDCRCNDAKPRRGPENRSE